MFDVEPHDPGSGGLCKEEGGAVVTETQAVGEEESVLSHLRPVEGGVKVQQLPVAPSLKCLEDHVATRELLAGIREEHAPVAQDDQIVNKIDEGDSLVVVDPSPGNENFDLF